MIAPEGEHQLMRGDPQRMMDMSACIVTCPICAATSLLPLFKSLAIPKYLLECHRSRTVALHAQRGELDFQFCLTCQFAFNAAFDAAGMDYAVDYEASRSSSAHFTNYLKQVAQDVVRICEMQDKQVVEVGCGDGQFLTMLRSLVPFTGYGVDPSTAADRIHPACADLQFIRGTYRHHAFPRSPDILLLRHVLEHQSDPKAFLQAILPPSPTAVTVYIEVPCWEWIVEHWQLQAFSYEHCTYFSRVALQRMLQGEGIASLKMTYGFADEYLQYYGQRQAVTRFDELARQPSLMQKTVEFARRAPQIIAGVRQELTKYPDAVVWGAAGKGTCFLNIVGLTYEQLPYVVDSNPRRWNTFIPCTGQAVIAPKQLQQIRPSVAFLSNPSYAREIRMQLETLGLEGTKLVAIDELIARVAQQLH